MNKQYSTLFLLALLSACADEKPKTSSGTGTSTSGATSNDELCVSLNSLSNGQFADVVSELCNGTLLSQLRSSQYVFTDASGSPNPFITASSSGSTSAMKLWASLRPSTDPKSYFNLMRLQISKPTDFSNSGFEVDSYITYTVNTTTADSTNYRYLNRRGDGDAIVEYVASSNYTQVTTDKLYLVTSKFESAPSDSVMKSFRGFQIIFKTSSGTTEVFSFADQNYDNKGDHQKTVNEATDALKDDMKRAMRNAVKATTANSFFP